MLDVQRWAEMRRMREVERLSIREFAKLTATIETRSAARFAFLQAIVLDYPR